MGDLNKRVRALEEQGGTYYPEVVIQEALGRIETEQLRGYVEALTHVVDGGYPAAEAEPAVNHILTLCEEIKKEGVL